MANKMAGRVNVSGRAGTKKAQSALEYLLTYSWSILLVSIIIAIIYFFVVTPQTIVPSACVFSTGAYCQDIAFETNTVSGSSILYVSLTNTQPYPIKSPQMQLFLSGTLVASDTCRPGLVQPGGAIICSITVPKTSLALGTLVSGSLYIAETPCPSGDATNCQNQIASQTFVGHFNTHVSPAVSTCHSIFDCIYCVGSDEYSGTNEKLVYYAPISSTGIGTWTSTTSYPVQMLDAGCSISNGYIYCVGTYTSPSNQVYYAPISPTGIGAWKPSGSYPINMMIYAGCSIYNSNIYCVGSDASPANQVYYAPISSTGIGTWTSTNSYPIAFNTAGCSISNGYIYCVGTEAWPYPISQKYVYYAPVFPTGVGAWQATGNYPVIMDSGGCSISNGYLYCIGAGSTSPSDEVYYAPISSSGVGTWLSTNSYPVEIGDTGCSISNGYIYCVGTEWNTPYNGAYYAPILGAGGVGNWISTTSYPVMLRDAYCQIPGNGGGYLGGGGLDSGPWRT